LHCKILSVIENISFPYPWWFICFCLAAGALYAFVLYRNETRFAEGPSWLKNVMRLLRFSAVSTIAFLLIGPIIKSLREDQKDPKILFLEDNSSSITAGMSKEAIANLDKELQTSKEKLKSKYEIETLYFGEEVANETKNKFTDRSTNISNALDYAYDNYADQNIGSIVLLSDGIFTEGSNPLYNNTKFPTKINTVLLGDTSIRKDLSIRNVLHNKIAYLGDKTSIQIDLSAYNCAGAPVKVKVEKNNGGNRKVIAEIPVNIADNNYFKTVDALIDADEAGIIKYTISVTTLSGEVSQSNNVRDIFLEVLDARQNILILANAPHPDMAALNAIITENKNYKITTAFANGAAKPNIGDFNLVILHNLPSDQNDAAAELNVIKNKAIPTLFIAGTQINQVKFNAVQDVVKIKGNSRVNEDVEALLSNDFVLFTLDQKTKNQIARFPPLTSSFGTYEAVTGADIFMYQKIKKIPTKYPLIAFSDKSGVKSAVIAGEGLWKWKINDYVENKNFDNVGDILNKIIQLSTAKDDKRKFRVNLPKNLFKENENIVFDAQLYNDAYEMINDPEVFLSIKDENRKEYKFNFSKNNNFYSLDAGLLPVGSYTYTASTNYKGNALSASGKFSVQSIQLEQYNLTANHSMLRELATKYNGRAISPAQIKELTEQLLADESIKPVIYQTSQSKSILHYKSLFFLILALLALEWFLRRFYGSY
jgi:hypothetical protein